MELFSTVLLLGFGVLGLVLLWRKNSANGKMPPGPRGLPVIGNAFSLSKDPPKQLAKWSKEYGDTITIKLGVQTMVILHDPKTAKAVLNDENYAGRDQNFEFVKLFKNNGLVFSEGEGWKVHRRFAIATLRDLGMGKNWFEEAILGEISELITIFTSHAGKPFGPSTHLMVAVSNVICAMIFGQRFEHSDVRFQKLLALLGENLQLQLAVTSLQFFPFLRHIPFGRVHSARKQFHLNFQQLTKFVQTLIRGHEAIVRADKSSEVGDYISRFEEEEKKRKIANSPATFTDAQLTSSIMDLFGAGAETSTTTLLWAFVFMIENPEVQRKVHEEISDTVGSRQIGMGDKVLLKYTDAVTLEIQRLGSIAPLGLTRMNFETAVVDGFELPPRTPVIANTYAIHRNPKYWSHPDTFYPGHFLDENGSIKIPKGFLPFGTGKRECLGGPLAKMEIFLFFARILQNFQIRAADGLPSPSSDKCFNGITRWPLPYKICFVPR